ncbi:hypothetical protein [Leptolyngbya sp. CCY15150]|nr:hypothetical protein [Leptolyngbya sp. CCY15150]
MSKRSPSQHIGNHGWRLGTSSFDWGMQSRAIGRPFVTIPQSGMLLPPE